MRPFAQIVELIEIILPRPRRESGWTPAKPLPIQPDLVARVSENRKLQTYGFGIEKKSLRKSATSCAPTSWLSAQIDAVARTPGRRTM